MSKSTTVTRLGRGDVGPSGFLIGSIFYLLLRSSITRRRRVAHAPS
jgi:hypothetical protein